MLDDAASGVFPPGYQGFRRKGGRIFTPLTPMECMDAPSRPYIVKGLLSQGDFGLIYGAPGAGKSVLAPHLAACVALGLPFFGHRVARAPVLYIAAEDTYGIRERFAALAVEHGDMPGLHLIADDVNLLDHDQAKELGRYTVEMMPGLVVLDTLNAAFPGLKENDAEQMGRAVQAVAGLSLACGSARVVVHHTPKSGDTPRGHGSLDAAADLGLRVEGFGTGARSVTASKNRSGPSGHLFNFGIKTVDIGADSDGDPRFRPVVDLNAPAGPMRAGRGLSKLNKLALDILHDTVARYGKPLPIGAGWPSSPMQGVPLERWREEAEARGLSQAETRKDRGRVFREAVKSLQSTKAVAMRDGVVWSCLERDRRG